MANKRVDPNVLEDKTWIPDKRGCSSVGRAVALQAKGREFDSPQLHHQQ